MQRSNRRVIEHLALWQAAGGGQLAAILILMQVGLGMSAPLSAVVERSNIHEVPPRFTGLTELALVNHTERSLHSNSSLTHQFKVCALPAISIAGYKTES